MTREEAYDAKIAPLMKQIIAIAQEHGIPMFATFSLPCHDDERLACTTLIPGPKGTPGNEQLEDLRCIAVRGFVAAPPMLLALALAMAEDQ